MPYNKLAELPKGVKNVLPYHAHEIYQAAFNNAWKEYRDKSKRRTN
ncbi:ChaB family protein, partial [Francisella tularensis]